MTIGNELDQAFYNLGQRLARLEKKEVSYPIENDFADKETVLGIEADLTSQVEQLRDRIAELVDHEISARVNGDLERIEAELNDRIDELENDMGFDPDDLRCDLESQIEELRDGIHYESDRIDELESYKITEEEAEYIVDRKLDDRAHEICDGLEDELTMLRDRVKELEDRLNKPTLGARVLRWLREGPSAKELATKWYAGLRRARV